VSRSYFPLASLGIADGAALTAVEVKEAVAPATVAKPAVFKKFLRFRSAMLGMPSGSFLLFLQNSTRRWFYTQVWSGFASSF
jgi:hypothetical protein